MFYFHHFTNPISNNNFRNHCEWHRSSETDNRHITTGYLYSCYAILLFCLLSLLWTAPVTAKGGVQQVEVHENHLSFVKNEGQWHQNVRFRADLGGLNAIFLEQRAFSYLYFSPDDVAQLHDLSQASQEQKDAFKLHGHRYKVRFLGSGANVPMSGINLHQDYNNYFIGDDPDKWVGHVPIYDGVMYQNLYNGIDLRVHSRKNALKYDFIVSEKANPQLIHQHYEGIDNMILHEDGRISIQTSVETIWEMRPYAYQVISGDTIAVPCRYLLDDSNVVSFFFPASYNHNLPLIIDPVVVAATLSGSLSTNYGHCATYDDDQNIYTGAISFGPGYATSVGAFDESFSGGSVDIAISKYNPTGTNRLFGTYIGGSGEDYPHSLIANSSKQIYIYGNSSSDNYPTTDNAFMTEYNGDADIIISQLSEDGASLIASTYVGGEDNDGLNQAGSNYGDPYRGEINLNQNNHVFIASCTQSNNFPTTPNALQTELNPGQDAVVLHLSPDLSTLIYGTYLGGDGLDMAYGIRIANDNSLYICGAAAADNFPGITPDGLFTSHAGGDYDGFVTHISSDGSTLLNGTFWGTGQNDQAYFIDISQQNDQILIYGQTEGLMPMTDGVWGTNNGNLFISALPNTLDNILYATTVGTNSGTLGGNAPVAFLIDQCGYIYFSCYGANLGMETSADAIFTEGGFYLGVLTPNALDLHYATYYSENHVDGGTSRFDKRGVVYQGVCSGGGFATNPDAWATDQIGGWDIGVFKIDFQTPLLTADISTNDPTEGCAPLTVQFQNNSNNAISYIWDFGDGSTSIDSLPIHTFTQTGNFNVSLIASNPESCNLSDTAYLLISVGDGTQIELGGPYNICQDPITLNAALDNAISYSWSTGETSANISVTEPGEYIVNINTDCGIISDTALVNEPNSYVDLGDDIIICPNDLLLLDLNAEEGYTYLWSNGSTDAAILIQQAGQYSVTVSNLTCQTSDSDTILITISEPQQLELGGPYITCGNPILLDATLNNADNYVWSTGDSAPNINVTVPGDYSVTVTTNCAVLIDTVAVQSPQPITVDLGDDREICGFNHLVLSNLSGDTGNYQWSTGDTSPILNIPQSGTYSLTITDNCGQIAADTVNVLFQELINIDIDAQLIICEDSSTTIDATTPNAIAYQWSNGSNSPAITVNSSGIYTVSITGECNTDIGNFDVTTENCNPLCANLTINHAVTCFNDVANTYTLYIYVQGGALPYNLSGIYNGTINDNNQLITVPNLPYGIPYSLHLVDANDCEETISDTPVCLTLPIELISWQIDQLPQGNNHYWATAAEVNNDYFTLERSNNGIEFTTVATIKGAGNSHNRKEYHHIDNYTLSGIVYYKLSQTDFDGNKRVIDIKHIYRNPIDTHLFSLVPTVTSGISYLIASQNETVPQAIYVFDSAGKLVAKQENPIISNNNQYLIDLSQYSDGIYWIQIQHEKQPQVLKAIKIGQ